MITDTLPVAGTDFQNPISANLFGVPAFFSGDTPISAIQRSFQAWAASLAPVGQSREEMASQAARDCPEGWEETVIRGRRVLRCRGRGMAAESPATATQIPQGQAPPPITGPVPDLRDLYPGIPLPPPGESVETPGRQMPQASEDGSCSPWDVQCIVNSFFGSETAKDIGKRAVLLVFAVVILVVAIISLR